jgi:cyclopropane fatty-acyl-phospholipid synthase-like methyltransferase
MIKESDIQAEHWNRRARVFGLNLKTLAYGSMKTQYRKFDILTSTFPKERITLLDVGCGFGDLDQYLKQHGYDVDYYGVDISSEIVSLANHAYPERRIICADILHQTVFKGIIFDYVVSTGVNCFNHKKNLEFERNLICKMFNLCKLEAVIGLQSEAAKWHSAQNQDQDSWYSNPGDYLNYVLKNLSPWANLMHDYMLHDFTLFVRKVPHLGS